MTLREKIQTMEAFERGETIECKYSGSGDWFDVVTKNPEFSWNGDNYRIKQKVKQTVVIEKWLAESAFEGHLVIEGTKEYIQDFSNTKVKLLDTYEVEL